MNSFSPARQGVIRVLHPAIEAAFVVKIHRMTIPPVLAARALSLPLRHEALIDRFKRKNGIKNYKRSP